MEREYSHIAEPLRALRSAKGGENVIFCEGRIQTGTQFVTRVAAISIGLRKLGFEPGERIAIAALNSEWYLGWLLAVPSAGCIIAPLNHRWSVQEASEAIREIEASAIVLDAHCLSWAPALKAACPSLRWVVFIGNCAEQDIVRQWIDAEQIIHSAGPHPKLQLLQAPRSIALICFTSGTTGRPKGAMLSHKSLIVQSLAKISVVGYSSKDIYLHTATLCHIGGISSALATIMANGCHVILPAFRAATAFHAIIEHKVSTMIVVPAMINDMISYWSTSHQIGGSDGKFRTLTTILNGAGSLSSVQLLRAKEMFPSSRIMSAYGMTEACSSITFLQLRDVQTDSGEETSLKQALQHWSAIDFLGVCVGESPPHVEVRIKSESNQDSSVSKVNVQMFSSERAERGSIKLFPQCARTLGEADARSGEWNGPASKAGIVLTRGAHVMDGYWGLNSETKLALRPDGWLDTGDVGWVDNSGYLWLLGRQKDAIRSGGETVYASEVEAVLVAHPAVLGAAVVGLADARLGETVASLVRIRGNWRWEYAEDTKEGFLERIINETLLQAHCRDAGLSRYKVPKSIVMQEEQFPMTTTGKVRKDDVRSRILSLLQIRQSVWGSEFPNSSQRKSKL